MKQALLLMAFLAMPAYSQPITEWRFDDADWMKQTADRIAKCVGTFRGAASFVRSAGHQDSATYLEDTARGYFLTAQMMLTQRADMEGRVLYGDDSESYIEGLAYGEEGRYKAMVEMEASDEMSSMMEGCVEVNDLVAALMQAMRETMTGVE